MNTKVLYVMIKMPNAVWLYNIFNEDEKNIRFDYYQFIDTFNPFGVFLVTEWEDRS